MQSSLAVWLTLGSGVVVLIAFVYELARPTEEARIRPLMLGLTAGGLGAIIASLPKLFSIESVAVRVGVEVLQVVCAIYMIRQLFRQHAQQRDSEESIGG